MCIFTPLRREQVERDSHGDPPLTRVPMLFVCHCPPVQIHTLNHLPLNIYHFTDTLGLPLPTLSSFTQHGLRRRTELKYHTTSRAPHQEKTPSWCLRYLSQKEECAPFYTNRVLSDRIVTVKCMIARFSIVDWRHSYNPGNSAEMPNKICSNCIAYNLECTHNIPRHASKVSFKCKTPFLSF